jgi:hypothetical protein
MTKLKIAARRPDVLSGMLSSFLKPSRQVLGLYLLLDNATSFRNYFTHRHNTV